MMTATTNGKEDGDTITTKESISINGSIRTTVSTGLSNSWKSDTSSSFMLRTDSRKAELTILDVTNDRVRKSIGELTINKLNLRSMDLVGRDQELSTLKTSLFRLCPQSNKHGKTLTPLEDSNTAVKNELVFIQGYSGIGKSTLIRALQKDVSSSNGAYVEGKYELNSIDKPYSGVARAFGDLCNKLKSRPSGDAVEKVTKSINDTMQEEAAMLMGLIPELSMFLFSDGNAQDKTVQIGEANIPSSNEHERWKHSFRLLTRILGPYFAVIVIVLDDIQWADATSLDIMDFLISDVENPHPLMIVGCYRSNEVDENSILYNRIQTLGEKHEKFGFTITNIKLENLDIDGVNAIVMAMLSIDNETKTQDLSEVCLKRTSGNPFFLIEFIKMLDDTGLLDFNLGLMKWVWDVAKINDATMSTSNVVDLLQTRMKKLSKDTQLLLQCAGCLRSSFSISTLKLVWTQYALRVSKDVNDPNMMGLLEVVRNEELIEPCGPEDFRWIHDKVQEAALSLSNVVTPSFQFGLGMCLYQGLDGPELEKQLFNVVDLINKGNVMERPDVDLSKLNLEAAKKAQKVAAFQSGAHYVLNGMKLLPLDAWTKHQNVALELYLVGTEMNLAVGNISEAKKYIRVVLDQDKCTAMEMMRLKLLKMEILGRVELRYNYALNYGMKLLKDIGYKLVWSQILLPIQALMSLSKTIKRLKKVPVAHFHSLELMEDPKQNAIMNLLSRIIDSAYHTNNLWLAFLFSSKAVELMLEYGLQYNSAGHIAKLAAFVMILKNNPATASHFCDIAFAIQKRFGRHKAAETIHVSVVFTLGYIRPLHELVSLTVDGYSQGMKDGENHYGIWNLLVRYVQLPFLMGRPLGQIAKDCQRISVQIEETKLTEQIFYLRVYWQMILNLQFPPCESSMELEGERFSQSSETIEIPYQIGFANFAIGELLLFFGGHGARTKRLMGEENGKTLFELMPGFIVGRMETFHRGIAWFAMARKNKGKKKYRAEALKIKKLIGKWAKAGDPNVQHYDRMLCAEEAALKKKHDMADQLYKDAIALAARGGHLHHTALFNERYGEYQLEVHGAMDDHKFYMEQAIKYYTEWGAVGKAEDLRAHGMTDVACNSIIIEHAQFAKTKRMMTVETDYHC